MSRITTYFICFIHFGLILVTSGFLAQSYRGSIQKGSVRLVYENNELVLRNLTSGCIPTARENKTLVAIGGNHCLNFYFEKNDCTGKFSRLEPVFNGVPVYFLGNEFHPYRPHPLVNINSSITPILSVRECWDKCDPRNWDKLKTNASVSVSLFAETIYKGYSETLTVPDKACVKIPAGKLRKVSSLQFLGNNTDDCIELHSSPTCDDGLYTILRPYYPSLQTLLWQGMHDKARRSASQAEAIGLCGRFCKDRSCSRKEQMQNEVSEFEHTIKDLEDSIVEFLHPEETHHESHVQLNIFFKYADSQKLKFNQCVPLNEQKHEIQVIKYEGKDPTQTCVTLYDQDNCTGFAIRWTPLAEDSHFYSFSFHDPLPFKSAAPCGDFCQDTNLSRYGTSSEATLTLYRMEIPNNYPAASIKINPGECIPLPPNLRVKSYLIKEKDACVLVHRNKHCLDPEGITVLRKADYVLSDFDRIIQTARAVSLCKTFCEQANSVDAVKDLSEISIEKGEVKMFDENGFHGEPTTMNLKSGCMNLKNHSAMSSTHFSLHTGKQCVVLFSGRNCQTSRIFPQTVQTSGKPLAYYQAKLASMTTPMKIRSLRLCRPEEMEVEDDEDNGSWSWSFIFLILIVLIGEICLVSSVTILLYRRRCPIRPAAGRRRSRGEEQLISDLSW